MRTTHRRRPAGSRFAATLAVALATLLWPALAPRAYAAPDPADQALASRLADLAMLTGGAPQARPELRKLGGVLLEAATRLDPDEPRYARTMARMMLAAGDPEGVTRALKAARRAAPDDRLIQAQLIDLYASQFQTVDAQLDYLRRIAAEPSVPDEVRAHAAYRAASAFFERAQRTEAKRMLGESLKLNPVSIESMRLYYDAFVARDGTPAERITALLGMLRANPNQLVVITQLAQELSQLGLVQPSLQFFAIGAGLAGRQQVGIPHDYALAYASELYVMNQPQAVKQLTDPMLAANDADFESLVLRLLTERAAAQKDAIAKTHQQAENVLVNQLQNVRRELGDATATTRPVTEATPVSFGNFADDVRKLTAGQTLATQPSAVPTSAPATRPAGRPTLQQLRDYYTQTLADLAWYEIYFRENPADAVEIMRALRDLLPEDNTTRVRLEGWGLLVAGKNDEAKVKLSAVADRDALAELGIIRMLGAENAGARDQAQALLNAHPSGLLAAVLYDGLRPWKVQVAPAPAVAQPIMNELSQFPAAWLGILDQPQGFYQVKVEPVKVAHPYGEPIILRVSMTNLSDFPITIGPDGVIRSDLWVDAQLRGAANQAVPACAFDQWTGAAVLKPHETIAQLVRADQGQLGQALAQTPFPPIQIAFAVRTNPTNVGAGIGPAGSAAQATRFVERMAFNLQGLTTLVSSVTRGGGGEKVRSLDLCGVVAVQLLQQEGNDQAKQAAEQLGATIRAATRDPSPSVAAWAGYVLAAHSSPQDRASLVQRMSADPQWASRLMALASIGAMGFDQQRAAARAMVNDTDPLVARYATVATQLLDWIAEHQPPATQPAGTQPATGPAGAAPPPPPALPGVGNPSTAPGAGIPATGPVIGGPGAAGGGLATPPRILPASRPAGSPSR